MFGLQCDFTNAVAASLAARGLQDAPRFIAYLDEVLPRHPELAALAELLDRRIRPALAEQAA